MGGSVTYGKCSPILAADSETVAVSSATTSYNVSFPTVTRGRGTIRYSLSLEQSGTGASLTSVNANGRAATISGMYAGGRFQVTCAATNRGKQIVNTVKTVVVNEGNPSMSANTKTTLASGTTSTSLSFNAATGGTGDYTYAMVKTAGSAGTLTSNVDGRTGTLSDLSDGDMSVVTCTATDSAGRTAQSTKAYGVAIDPSYTFAQWDVVETLKFDEFPVASYTATQTVEGKTYTVATAGTPGTCTHSYDADGLNMTTTASVTGDSFCLSIPLNKDNFKNTETFIVEAIMKLDGCTSTSGVMMLVSSATTVNTNNQFGIQLDGTGSNVGNIIMRKYTASTLTLGSTAVTTFAANTWYSIQLIIMQGSICYASISQSDSFLNGYSYNTSDTIGGGAYTQTIGGVAITTGTVQPGPFRTNMKLNFITYAGNHKLTVREVQVLRATRPVQG